MRYFILVITLLAYSELRGQSPDVATKLKTFFQKFEPEFVELHTDANIYRAGDNIWYSVFVTNPNKKLLGSSMVSYVELVDATNAVVTRDKVMCQYGHGHGNISLPASISSGKFELRAYTNWMRNFGESAFVKSTVYVGDTTLTDLPGAHESFSMNIGDAKLTLSIRVPINGYVLLYQFDKVLLYQKLSPDCCREIVIATDEGFDKYQPISLVLFDVNGQVLKQHTFPAKEGVVSIKLNKINYSVREKVMVSLTAEKISDHDLKGSIVVRKKDRAVPNTMVCHQIPIEQVMSENDVRVTKEVLVYPPQGNSLPSLRFNRDDLLTSSNESIWMQIMKSYEITNVGQPQNLDVPSDNTYFISSFAPLPTIETFLREVVPQVRIQKQKSIKSIRLRNIENTQNVYFYKKDPLLLIDNEIITNIDEFLNFNPAEVERVDVAWRSQTINSSGIYALADNGIVSIKTKSGAYKRSGSSLYESFNVPLEFPTVSHERTTRDDIIPDFRNTVYWNPNLQLDERQTLSFYLSDETGEFEIDVVGYDSRGRCVRGKRTIIVE